MVPVFSTVCDSSGGPSAKQTGQPDGLPLADYPGRQQIQMAIMGHLQPKLQVRSSGEPGVAMGKG